MDERRAADEARQEVKLEEIRADPDIAVEEFLARAKVKCYFDDMQIEVIKAQLLWYGNSGYYRFLQHKQYDSASDGTDIDWDV